MKLQMSVVIVSHEHIDYIRKCIDSVLRQKGVFFEVIVVDNASRDGTAEYVRRVFPVVHLVEQKNRFGFSTNVNAGIRKAKGEYVVVLNPDTVLFPNVLSVLVHFMDTHPLAGICGPKLINADGTVQMSYRNFPSWKTALFRRTLLRKWFVNSSIVRNHLNSGARHDVMQETDWMLGACLLLRHSMITQIGLFDDQYRLYVEDIDICRRAHEAGWQVWYVPQAVVTHNHNAISDRKLFSLHSWYHFMSMIHYINKYWKDIIPKK